MVPWQRCRSFVWDVTVVCPVADSYVASAAREARSVAELAETKKEDKYSGLAADYFFSQLRSRLSAQLMSRTLTFSHFWPRKLVITPFPCWCSDSTACCYTIPLCLRTARSNGHSDNFLLFFPNPSGSLIPMVGYKITIIIAQLLLVYDGF